jgi:uncharacterized protein (DUF427 family)/acyl-CoA thioesterase
MLQIESAWPKYPDYVIDLVPVTATARVWHNGTLLAESTRCLRLEETKHVDRLYFPESDVRWELFEETSHFTICPFKGQACYWSLTGVEPHEENVVWAYKEPFDEVAGIKGYVCFYHERVTVEMEEQWGAGRPSVTVNRFPAWGDATDLVHLLDVEPAGPNRFTGPPYRNITRNVVEGGQMLAQAIVAASKAVPDKRVTTASMVFPRPAAFDAPLDLSVDVVHSGRTFSTVTVRIDQHEKVRSTGQLLMDAGSDDVIHHEAAMPDIPGPSEAEPYDMWVTGRDLRIVDAAYTPDPDHIGPPQIYAWMRFRDDPGEVCLRQALVAQATTHWTIGAAMRPHPGFGEADAHVTLSTGIMAVGIAFHDDAPVTEWFLYENPAIWAGRGLAQGQGRIWTGGGRLIASYTVQAMIRQFARDPAALGLDATNAM